MGAVLQQFENVLVLNQIVIGSDAADEVGLLDFVFDVVREVHQNS